MKGVDHVVQAHINLLADQFHRQLVNHRLISRSIYSHHWRSTVSAETVCCGWVAVAFMVLWLFRIRSKSWKKLRCHHPIAICCVPCPNSPLYHKTAAISFPLVHKVLSCILQVMSFLIVIMRLRLIISGDVELNPGPLDQGGLKSMVTVIHWVNIFFMLQKFNKFYRLLMPLLLVRTTLKYYMCACMCQGCMSPQEYKIVGM